MREIVFDTETTGLSPADGHRLVEIGCVELFNRVETGRTFHAWFNPDRDMPTEAFEVHGLSAIFLSDKPRFHEMVSELIEFLGDAPLVAHNAGFDMAFLDWELKACARDPICRTRMIDTLALARAKHPGAKHSLDALCTRYGIDRSQRIKHGALIDAQLLAQLYVELTGGRQIGLMLAAEPIVAAGEPELVPANINSEIIVATMPRPPRPHGPSEAELERHAAFVATLTNPLWAGTAA
ncbi:DNA polymerase III subunit epsilon [Sphingomonas quercus]|uniref:DNA polymerase III subunit epsilon n=1 Tax=Sphingomonas quercus TaxID=2842451 RepID=A0ABS6BF46_9SPHN|nr:DNA polymerase III subunit epsilon [Sphingomonas quercus]MBU3076921.1 DNA polymerase III subunit epsilon [Sphingomonas quercus]